jgi:flagellar basal body-associated protein FliL
MANEVATPPKNGKSGLLIWGLVAGLAVCGGAAAPWLYFSPGHTEKKNPDPHDSRPSVVPFGDVVVNLDQERLTRYLRVKVLLVVEENDVKEVTDLLQKQKAFLKSWLIGYLSDQSLQDVGRNVGLNRIRREIRDEFNRMLCPDNTEKIYDILFDEFVVQ